eukprot:859455-Rhodomonas_salina.1
MDGSAARRRREHAHLEVRHSAAGAQAAASELQLQLLNRQPVDVERVDLWQTRRRLEAGRGAGRCCGGFRGGGRWLGLRGSRGNM